MKPQDVIFLLIGAMILWKKNSHFLGIAGIVCIILSIPLFAMWVFFTAERLTWYAAAFLLIAIIFEIFKPRKND